MISKKEKDRLTKRLATVNKELTMVQKTYERLLDDNGGLEYPATLEKIRMLTQEAIDIEIELQQ